MIDSTNKLVKDYGKEYPKGTTLFSEGEAEKELYIIDKGKVEVSKVVNGIKKVITTLGEGDFFGEMSILADGRRTATATVIEDSIIVSLDEETFDSTVALDSSILYMLLKKVCQRLKDTTNELAERL